MGSISEKTKTLYAELNERAEEATINYSVTGDFLLYLFCACGQKASQDPIKVLNS